MGGGLMQLVAYGAQDVYLTGNPQITFFKVVYRRHTNFSMECIEQPLDSGRFNGRHTVQVLRNGDLAGRMYIKTTLPALKNSASGGKVAWCRRPGHAMLQFIECTVGGSQVDKHWGQWYDVWYELTHTVDQERGYNKMVGDVPELTTLSTATPGYTVYVPLQFWFNRNTGLALPLIALQYHEVRFNIQFNPLSSCVVTDSAGSAVANTSDSVNATGDLSATSILVDYIYLDQEERRRMAQVGHEYLIEQLQFNGEESINGTSQSFKLDFNHPCKELIWVVRANDLSAHDAQTFLTYHNGDQVETLQRAADNLARGMVSVGSTPSGSGWVNADSSDNVAAGQTALVTVNNGSGSGTNFSFVVDNTVNTSQYNYSSLWVNAAALGGPTGVSTKVTSVTVSVTVDASGNGTINSVTADTHTLTITDVSKPVSSLNTDARSVKTSDVKVNQPFNYGVDIAGNGNMVKTAKIQLNGHDRFDEQAGDYFNYVQPYQHHTRTPADGVNVYSFGLHPEQHQPSGTANLSRIDTTKLNLQLDSSKTTVAGSLLWIFAFSYNVFRIMSGMGGLAYAN